MTAKTHALATLFLLLSCGREPGTSTARTTAQFVPVTGPESFAKRLMLANAVIDALPSERVRAEVKKQFPDLSDQQLANISVSAKRMIMTRRGGRPKLEVDLAVLIQHDPPIASSGRVTDFVAALLSNELAHQRAKIASAR
jgi:hypothetical protein